ncbi:MAG TPA: tetratricopeptide repeat protein [Thermoguttaceae bacterium]|nr:tetratricopeptide repeat protein [Thermoguttaceae bacterium]
MSRHRQLTRKALLYFIAAVAAAAALAAVVQSFRTKPGLPVDDVLSAYRQDADYRSLAIRYPLDGTLFPPEIVAPTFLWRDDYTRSNAWVVKIEFPRGGQTPMSFACSQTQFRPSDGDWEAIKKRSLRGEAKVTVVGIDGRRPKKILSAGTVSFGTSEDEAEAPLFYREVNLPFIDAVKDPSRIRWRCGVIFSKERPKIVLENLPVCGNCHSFSADGEVLGMDVDYANDKGSYAIAQVEEEIVLDKNEIITWSDYEKEDNERTYGLLSQVSPDGKYVVSTVQDRSVFVPKPDLAFSQLFFPIKGILVVYSRRTGDFQALPGADDKRCVQSNPSWSPDGKTIVFARSEAYELQHRLRGDSLLLSPEECAEFLEGRKSFLFDLYRIPFNDGRGGRAEPLEGASGDGMSNYFPRYSPDGKWIVFCKAKSYMLLQPDSQLYIVPAAGGRARRLRCNTTRMNSWHSWSPNGKWLVFSSKANSAYTQLFLTHIDRQGHSTPPVLLEQFTGPDRAANIPEFVNVEPGRIKWICERFVDDESFLLAGTANVERGNHAEAERQFRKGLQIDPNNAKILAIWAESLIMQGRFDQAEVRLERAVELAPDEKRIHFNLGNTLRGQGKLREAEAAYRKALRIDPESGLIHYALGTALVNSGEVAMGRTHLVEAIRLFPDHPGVACCLGMTLLREGKLEEAATHLSRALELDPDYLEAMLALASLRATCPQSALRNAEQAVALATRACELTNYQRPDAIITLSDSHAAAGNLADAVSVAYKALQIADQSGETEQANMARSRLRRYGKR